MPAREPRRRSHVDDVVGRPDRILVMLDHEHGVAQGLQPPQRDQQPLVVALVQPDRRLVEHVQHPGQSGADLACQPDALALATGERRRSARQRQVIEPDIDQELQPLDDLAQDAAGDLFPLRRQRRFHAAKPFERRLDRKIRGLRNVAPRHTDRQRLRLEPRAVADGAGFLGLVARHFLANPGAVRLLPAPLEIVQDALEGLLHRVGAHAVLVGECDFLVRAVQDRIGHALRQIMPRRARTCLEVLGNAGKRLVVIGTLGAAPGGDRALGEADPLVRHDQRRVKESLDPETVASRAGAVRAVEAEQPRLDLLDREAGDRAGEAAGKHGPRLALGRLGVGDAVGEPDGRFKTVGEAALDPRPDHDPVDHRLDLVLDLAVQRRDRADLEQFSVDLHAGEAAALEFGDFLAVFALAVAHNGREQQQPRAFRHRRDPVDHLADRLRLDRQAGCGRVGHAGPCPEQAHVVVDFRHRADGGTRVAAGGLLLDRNGGREALDRIDVRLAGQLQELPRVGGKALDIAALSLGIDRVEGERGLARAGQPGDDREAVAGDLDVDVLEIVLARAAHADGACHDVGDSVAFLPCSHCGRVLEWREVAERESSR